MEALTTTVSYFLQAETERCRDTETATNSMGDEGSDIGPSDPYASLIWGKVRGILEVLLFLFLNTEDIFKPYFS